MNSLRGSQVALTEVKKEYWKDLFVKGEEISLIGKQSNRFLTGNRPEVNIDSSKLCSSDSNHQQAFFSADFQLDLVETKRVYTATASVAIGNIYACLRRRSSALTFLTGEKKWKFFSSLIYGVMLRIEIPYERCDLSHSTVHGQTITTLLGWLARWRQSKDPLTLPVSYLQTPNNKVSEMDLVWGGMDTARETLESGCERLTHNQIVKSTQSPKWERLFSFSGFDKWRSDLEVAVSIWCGQMNHSRNISIYLWICGNDMCHIHCS